MTREMPAPIVTWVDPDVTEKGGASRFVPTHSQPATRLGGATEVEVGWVRAE